MEILLAMHVPAPAPVPTVPSAMGCGGAEAAATHPRVDARESGRMRSGVRCAPAWPGGEVRQVPTYAADQRVSLRSIGCLFTVHSTLSADRRALLGVSSTDARNEAGDMGADIIKIEPLGGEWSRRWAEADMGGASGPYLSAFRNKKLLAVNLKTREDRKVVLSRIEQADVVVEADHVR